jgi:hypothetical protein
MPAYFLNLLPNDESSRRKAFAFAKELGADMIIVPADPTSFGELDKLANETGMNVAVVNQHTAAAMAALTPLSHHIGLSVDLAAWAKGRCSTTRWIEAGKGQAARRRPAQCRGCLTISPGVEPPAAAGHSARLAASPRWRRKEIRRQAALLHPGSGERATFASSRRIRQSRSAGNCLSHRYAFPHADHINARQAPRRREAERSMRLFPGRPW